MINRRDFLKTGVLLTGGASLGLFSPIASHGAKKVRIKVGYLPITDHLLVMAAVQAKLNGVEIEPVKFSSWPDVAEALKTGAIEAAFLLTPIGITLRQKGVPLKVVGLGHRNGSVITVKTGDEISGVEDLKGAKIAIPSRFSTHNILLRKILADKGMNADRDLTLLDMAPPEMPVALATGKIDGFIVAEPFGVQAEYLKAGRVLMLSKDIWKDHICCVLNVREEFTDKYPEAVREMLSGMEQTARFISDDPAAASKLSKKFIGQKPEIVEHVLTKPAERLTFNRLKPEMSDFEATQEYMIKFGIADERIALNEYVDSRFYPV